MFRGIPMVVGAEGELLELELLRKLPMVDGEEEGLLVELPVQGELRMVVVVVVQGEMVVVGCWRKEELYL
jgi:hypothetical protein